MSELLAPRLMGLRKDAMKNKEDAQKRTLQSIGAAFKQRVVDEQIEALTVDQEMQILVKMVKQRRDSISQFESAGREDLAVKEREEVAIIESFMPQPLTPEEIKQGVEAAIAEVGATTMQEMGAVMAKLKPVMSGKADMGKVSGMVRKILAS